MSKAPDAGIETDDRGPVTPPTPWSEPSARPLLSVGASQILALVLILAVVAAGIFAVQAYRRHQQDGVDTADAASAVDTARQFAERVDNFDSSNLAPYEKGVRQLLAPSFQSKFKSTFPAFQQLYTKSHAVSRGTVRVAGLQNIDPDSATVLVIHDQLVTSDYGNQQQYLRWSVTLSKVGGAWRVDNFVRE